MGILNTVYQYHFFGLSSQDMYLVGPSFSGLRSEFLQLFLRVQKLHVHVN